MSTKIYDGLIATDSDPFTIGHRIRDVLSPIFLRKFKHMYEAYKALPEGSSWDTLSRFIDSKDALPKVGLDKHLYDKIAALHKSSSWTFSDADISYDVTLVPNGSGGNPLVMVFGENNREYIEALKNAGVVDEYGYWDNSDAPEELTEEQWEERRKAWSTLDDAAPIEVGLGVSAPSSMEAALYLYGHSKYSS